MVTSMKIPLDRLGIRRRRSGDNPETITAAVLHIDTVGSTALVRRDPLLAHRQVQRVFRRTEQVCRLHSGTVLEKRGDAMIIRFHRVNDAVAAASIVHWVPNMLNKTRLGRLEPDIRTGISFGPLIIDDDMVTGEPVILAQRLEQLAAPGKILLDQYAYEHLEPPPGPQARECGYTPLKGFGQDVAVYEIDGQTFQQSASPAACRNTVARAKSNSSGTNVSKGVGILFTKSPLLS